MFQCTAVRMTSNLPLFYFMSLSIQMRRLMMPFTRIYGRHLSNTSLQPAIFDNSSLTGPVINSAPISKSLKSIILWSPNKQKKADSFRKKRELVLSNLGAILNLKCSSVLETVILHCLLLHHQIKVHHIKWNSRGKKKSPHHIHQKLKISLGLRSRRKS